MPFSAKSLDFIFENYMNDSKTWFNEHKEEHKKYITEPFAELVNGLADTMREIDSEFICDPKKVSRMYRDARYAKGGPIFRDYVWYTFCRPHQDREPLLGYYFSISPDGFDYGCGYYCSAPAINECYRQLILSGDKSFGKALKAYKKQDFFTLYGDMYKRNKYPGEPAENQDWLNRKNLGVSGESKDFKLLFSDKLIEKVAADFKAIAPIYDFYRLSETIASQKSSE